jgi:hypothetical protein
MHLLDRIAVPDGEFLRYGKYAGGEKTATILMVNRFEKGKGGERLSVCYMEGYKVKNPENIPADYRDYHARRVFSLETGTLEDLSYNFPVTNVSKLSGDPSRLPGEFYRHYIMNGDTLDMETRTCRDDKTNSFKSRVVIKAGYPAWDLDSTLMYSFRYFDVFKPGIFYVVVPAIVKEPLPVSFKVIGREKIKTGMGEFDTIKLGVSISDPFLGKLLDSFLESTTLWIENSDRKLLVKMDAAGVYAELEAVSNVIK